LDGFTGTVDLSLTGLPSNTSVDFDPPAITGSGWFELTLRVDDDTRHGSYKLTVTGTSGSLRHSVDVDLHVQ